MIDASYADPVLVALYDGLNGWSDGRDFYLSLPRRAHERILDAGCGTGMLTVAFSKKGHDVVGIDPAQAMLDVAMRREGEHDVDWRCSTLQDFRSKDDFDLIYMTGHAFQCLLDDHDILAAFQCVARLLRQGGRFVFETRNPAVRPWLRWEPEPSRQIGTTPDGQPFEMFHKVLQENGRLVTFETTYRIGNEGPLLLSKSTLRFCGVQETVRLAQQSGLELDCCWGDWDRSPLSASSREIIMSLKR